MLESFLQRMRSAAAVPSLPTVAVQVLQLTKQSDTSVDKLANVIQNDPAMAAKVLKTVNSPLFGIPREVGSLKQAIALLGLRRVTMLALSFSLVETMQGGAGDEFDFANYWRRSLSTAVAGRLISKVVAPAMTEESFVIGLLSDIGIVVAWRAAADLYWPALVEWQETRRPIEEIEQRQFGFTHALLGSELLRSWGLPEALCDAVEAHHGDGLEGLSASSKMLARFAHSAATIADLFLRNIPSDQLDRVKAQCLEETDISDIELHMVLESLDKRVRETAASLAIEVGTTINYAQLQAEATMQLAQLSIEAETERAEADRQAQDARLEARRLHQEKATILEAASTDGLTRLANRAAFDTRLSEELKRARVKGHSLSLIFADVDHFKSFNDTFGHQVGDEVLRHVGACLSEQVRSLGFAARYGGEEFVIIVAGEQSENVRLLAELIRKAIEVRRVRIVGLELSVTVSLGAACVHPRTEDIDAEHLIRQADQQLYLAKRGGRNRVAMALPTGSAARPPLAGTAI